MKNILLCAALFSVVALGVTEVPEGDPLQTLLALFQNWSALAPLAKASAVIMLFVQLVKKFLPSFEYYNVVVVVGGLLYGTVEALASGMDLLSALVFILITSGGAVALYNLFKGVVNPVFKIPSK